MSSPQGLRSHERVPLAAVLLSSLGVFVALSQGPAVQAGLLGLLVATAVTISAVSSWRRVFFFLIAYLPYSGLLGLLAYPRTLLGEAVRDLALIVPLYAALLPRMRKVAGVPGPVVATLLLLAALVVVQTFNPSIPVAAVGAVGARGWLFFIPFLWIGARVAQDRRDLRRWARISVVAGAPVLLIGVAQAALLVAGATALVQAPYGAAAAAAFGQGGADAGFAIGGGSLRRIPSLFTFPLAYYAFSIGSLVPSYVLWRGDPDLRWRRVGAAGFGLALLASLSSGTRLAFLLVPALLVVILVFDRRFTPRFAAIGTGAWLSVVWFFGIDPASLPSYFRDLSAAESGDVLVGGFSLAREVTTLGLGTGMDTNASRQVYADVFAPIGHDWQESYLVKAWLELGAPGFVVVVTALLSLLGALVHAAVHAHGAQDRALASSALALATATALLSIKGSVLDQAPANILFWLYAGMALGTASRSRHDRARLDERAACVFEPAGASVRAGSGQR